MVIIYFYFALSVFFSVHTQRKSINLNPYIHGAELPQCTALTTGNCRRLKCPASEESAKIFCRCEDVLGLGRCYLGAVLPYSLGFPMITPVHRA